MSSDRVNLDKAGLTDYRGFVGQSGTPPTWVAPESVWLDGDLLRFKWGAGRRISAPPDLLDVFTRLAKPRATDAAFERFAQHYGVVALCERHGQPIGHLRELGDDPDNPYPCEGLGGEHPYLPIDWLRDFARKVTAALNIAAQLQNGGAADRDAWFVLDPEYAGLPNTTYLNWSRPRPMTPSEEAEDDREHLGDILDRWLDLADVRLRIDWTDARPDFRLTPRTLLGAITTSLVFSIARQSLAVCTACGRAYTPTRRPTAGRRNYCPDPDCKDARDANNQRDYVARTKKKATEQ
jgi:hypothetical protein